jgi:aminoacrylate hydrolase
MSVLLYEVCGRSDRETATVFLSSGLGGAAAFWMPQIDALVDRYRVVTYDHRGAGANQETLPVDLTIADMADDVLAIFDAIGVGRSHFVGHALGGLIGLQIALARPERLERLVVVNSWSRADVHTVKCFAIRQEILRRTGPELYLKLQPLFLYPAPWLSSRAALFAQEETVALANFPGVSNTLTRIRALLAFNVHDRLGEVATPTLVAASMDDLLVPYTRSEALAAGLRKRELFLAEAGGHAFTAVHSALFNDRLLQFLDSGGPGSLHPYRRRDVHETALV